MRKGDYNRMYELVRLIIIIAFVVFFIKFKSSKKKVILRFALPVLIAIVVIPIEGYLFNFSLKDSFNYSFGNYAKIRNAVECGDNGLVFYTDREGFTYRVYHKYRNGGWNVISPNFDFLISKVDVTKDGFIVAKQYAGNHKVLIMVSEWVLDGQSKNLYSVLSQDKLPLKVCETRSTNHMSYNYYEFQDVDEADDEVIINDEVYKIE